MSRMEEELAKLGLEYLVPEMKEETGEENKEN
jgi:hypothetical protein